MIKKIKKEQTIFADAKAHTDSEHNSLSHLYLEPGKYEHTCSSCGKITKFVITDYFTHLIIKEKR